jgi:hypothetical protein
MSLATVIRMEFAYPGVGILAGDSIQYLSIATAHGVIMVFFMIMPAIFGAFGNFLLPTQLGVHDVAFPRLNSAAFWFLPGGLIMLCQLVCVDRRYQRMNCFNIRELQGILKRKFFTDLVNTTDSHKATESTLINMRHKNNMSNILLYDQSLLYNFDLTNLSKSKNFSFSPGKIYSYTTLQYPYTTNTILNFFTQSTLYINLINIYKIFCNLLKDFFNFLTLPNLNSVLCLKNTLTQWSSIINFNLNFNILSLFSNNLYTIKNTQNSPTNDNIYVTNSINYTPFSLSMSSSFAENSSTWRFNRYSYPLISYDYKCGNYLSI